MFTETTKTKVEAAFEKRFANLPMPAGLADTISQATMDEAICLKFCYAFMPAADIADYPVELFLKVTRQALSVQKQNLFGEASTDEMFLNYVLQCRVNNENLEFNRDIFFNELYPRIKGMTAAQAALEVNYWCLEKATYTGNSQRTMSPLTLLKNTMGRCGEESLFTVSAMRSVGIPARQIYTPNWAHSESNHAWVEVFVGGGWHFLGACEPEPVLDKGWFPGPASKGIIIHTRIFSNMPPQGDEVAFVTDTTCEINRTAHYAQSPVKLMVKVLNSNANINVHVQIVSYCILLNQISLKPDKDGVASVTIGKGDIYLCVEDGINRVARRVDTRVETDVEIDFSTARPTSEDMGEDMLFVPPHSDYSEPDYGLTPDKIKAHEERVARCHELRKAYADTFADEAKGLQLAQRFGPNHFNGGQYFVGAKGNLDEIIKFMESPGPFKYKYLLLKSLEAKDYTDSTAATLTEHLAYALPYKDDYYEEIFEKYVLCPRIRIEMITPYREFIHGYFSDEQKAGFTKNPPAIWQWIEANIQDADEYRTGNDRSTLPVSPVGLLTYKHGGQFARTLLFVAICRSLGIPARLNPADGAHEYYCDGNFVKVVAKEEAATVELILKEKNGAPLISYSNFSLVRLKDGSEHLHNLGYGKAIDAPIKVEPGNYRILTGRRLENGTMMVKLWHVNITDDTTLEVEIPAEEKNAQDPKPLGDYNFGDTNLISLLTGKDLVACIRPTHEPTEHLLRELLESRAEYKRRGVRLVLVALKDNATLEKIKAAYEGDITVIPAPDDAFAQYLAEKTGLSAANLPVMAMVSNGMAVYYGQGYNVGSVAMALKALGSR